MSIDHVVVNVDKKYQTDTSTIDSIKNAGFPYEPKWGKGTAGFKASNIWIGNEYFEMIRLLKKHGGGWRKEWVERYNRYHRGLICLFIDTDNISGEYDRLRRLGIAISDPEYLKFKWFFNILTRTMPWQNAYLPFFEGVPFQLGFQQMKDEASRDWMRQYMIPNSRDNGIEKIKAVNIYGNYSDNDKLLINSVFTNTVMESDGSDAIEVLLPSKQSLAFIQDEAHHVEVLTRCENEELKGGSFEVHNIRVLNI